MPTTVTPRLAAENLAFPFADYLADPSRRLVCAAIPKSGCSDLKHWFISLVEPAKLADPSFRLHAYCRAAHTLARFPVAERESLLRESFTIGFVREPLSRVVSAYVEKFVRAAQDALFEPAREVLAQIGGGRSDGITFREFVGFLEAAPDEHLDPHWRPQAAFIRGVGIDLLGRMEHQGEILGALGRELGMPERVTDRRNATGYTPPGGRCVADVRSGALHASGVLPPASDLYDDELRAKVLTRFREDSMLVEGATDHLSGGVVERVRAVVSYGREPHRPPAVA